MTDQFVDVNKMVPITPPPELVEEWANASARTHRENGTYAQHEFALATQAARWGADRELEACCEWVGSISGKYGPRLRLARRPKPPSLKEQALGALYAIATGADDTREFHQDIETIKEALESLPS